MTAWVKMEHIGDHVLYLGDCLEIMPELGPVDAVVTDPPYGIGKADWDNEFSLDWMLVVGGSVKTLAVTPGNWNLLSMPMKCGRLDYKWTLSAHLINGMTRGRVGFGNWIPCVIYEELKEYGPSVEPINDWCGQFALWLDENSITTKELNKLLGTSSMAGRFRERTWGVLPSRAQWNKIKTLNPPDKLTPEWNNFKDYTMVSDSRIFTIGLDKKPNHPSPKPLNVMCWFIEVINPKIILDPFMGSGTTGVACEHLKRKFIGIEIEPKYFDIACKRIAEAVRHPTLGLRK